jgi:hypothetical protein
VRLPIAPRTLAAAALLAAACGALFVRGGRARAFAFPHDVHVLELELECENCHEDAMLADRPAMPAPDTCEFCHVELDAEAPPERQAAALFDGPAYRAAHATALASELAFDHARHAAAVGDCAACHADVIGGERVESDQGLAMAACVDCHAERGAPGECATCHLEIDRDWAPPSHAAAWKKLHGRVFRAGCTRAVDDCALCHQETDCASCHAVEAPESHGPLWRLRSHGLAARIDRASCAACHQPTGCDRCHAEVLPLSHVATWGDPKDTHCIACHFPLGSFGGGFGGSEGCATCHKSNPSHLLASPKPSWHTPDMNCLMCHAQTLPHVTKGDDCNLCHL